MKTHEINTGIKVIGWDRYLILSDLFDRQFNPSDGIYGENDPRIAMKTVCLANGEWAIWIHYTHRRKYTTEQYLRFDMFIRGVIATLEYRSLIDK